MPTSYTCYYCGEPASTIDHIIPQSIIADLRALSSEDAWQDIGWYTSRIKTVPACRECNSLLSSDYYDTISERKHALKDKLRQRYKKLLSMPKWTDVELDSMGSMMRDYIIQGRYQKARMQRRLAY